MRSQLFAAVVSMASASAHIALWDKGMFGKNYPGQDGDSMVYWNNNNPVLPLREADALVQSQWWAHGHLSYPPKSGDFMVLPAGGSYTGEHACNRGLTTLRNPQNSGSLPQYACDGNLGDGIGALHVNNKFGSAPDPQWFGGTALAIAYTSDPKSVGPNDFTVISVNYNSVWERLVSYSIPQNLPACPAGGCLCTWNWIHQAGHGEGYPFEMYNNLYRCTVTGASATKPVQRGSVPKECAGNPANCVSGPKTPMYIYQADGNNIGHLDVPPSYNSRYGFSNGAQNDIFATASTPAPSTGEANPWATPTVPLANTPTATATTLPTGWKSLGCMVDHPDNRALNAGAWSAPNMTIESCVGSCKSRGYLYAGIEYGVECWCGDKLSIQSAPPSECNVHCGGDPWAYCGGSYRLSVFIGADIEKNGTVTDVAPGVAQPFPAASLPSGWSSLGCHEDYPDTRALNAGMMSATNMTVPICIANCAQRGYVYSGVENGNECWCGTSTSANSLKKASDQGSCSVKCAGDSSTLCGGGYRIDVFKFDAPTFSATSMSSSSSLSLSSAKSTAASSSSSSSLRPSSSSSSLAKSSISSSSSSVRPSPSSSASRSVSSSSSSIRPSSSSSRSSSSSSSSAVKSSSSSFSSSSSKPSSSSISSSASQISSSGSARSSGVLSSSGAPRSSSSSTATSSSASSAKSTAASSSSSASLSRSAAASSTTASSALTSTPSSGLVPSNWVPRGCRAVASRTRPVMLDGFSGTLRNLTAAMCIDYCGKVNPQIKYTLAGLMNGNMCFCASEADLGSGIATGCNSPCSGNTKFTCGGPMRTEVFQLDESVIMPKRDEVVVGGDEALVAQKPSLFGRRTRGSDSRRRVSPL